MSNLKLIVETSVNTHELKMLEAMEMAYAKYKPEIVAFIESKVPDLAGELETFEGGIDSWYGFGSVMLYELGIRVNIQISADHDGFDIILS